MYNILPKKNYIKHDNTIRASHRQRTSLYIYIKPKPLLAPQFSTSAQYLKNKK